MADDFAAAAERLAREWLDKEPHCHGPEGPDHQGQEYVYPCGCANVDTLAAALRSEYERGRADGARGLG